MKIVSESVTIKPETLPSTASAAAFHTYREFYQTQKWNTLMKKFLDPTDWGCILENDYMVPVLTDMNLRHVNYSMSSVVIAMLVRKTFVEVNKVHVDLMD